MSAVIALIDALRDYAVDRGVNPEPGDDNIDDLVDEVMPVIRAVVGGYLPATTTVCPHGQSAQELCDSFPDHSELAAMRKAWQSLSEEAQDNYRALTSPVRFEDLRVGAFVRADVTYPGGDTLTYEGVIHHINQNTRLVLTGTFPCIDGSHVTWYVLS